MYGGPPAGVDREVTWQSVTAGVVLNALFLGFLVVVSHPVAAGSVLALGVGLFAAREVLGRVTYERTVQLCRPPICLRFQLRVG